jgi:hypothetical protein
LSILGDDLPFRSLTRLEDEMVGMRAIAWQQKRGKEEDPLKLTEHSNHGDERRSAGLPAL